MRASDTLVIKSRDAFQPLVLLRTRTCKLERRSRYKTLELRSSLQSNIFMQLSIESMGILSNHCQTKFARVLCTVQAHLITFETCRPTKFLDPKYLATALFELHQT